MKPTPLQIAFSVALIFLLSACADKKPIIGPNPNFHLYLCFGQSNMEGTGPIEAQDTVPKDRFMTYQALDCPNLNRVKGQWYPAVPPTTNCNSGLSPADYFGRYLVDHVAEDIEIGVVSVAVGGCDIRLFDKHLYTDHDSTYEESWFADKIIHYEGNPYQYLINAAKEMQKEGVIKGILLHQGETNTGDTLWPQYVSKVYNDMLSDLSLIAEDVPLFAGEVVGVDSSCCAAMNPIINTLPTAVPTAHIISSDGLTAQDPAHFDSEGYRVLGRRYAEKVARVKGYRAD